MQRILLAVTIIILFTVTIYRIFSGISSQPRERWDEQTNIDVVTNSLSRKSFPVLYLDNKPFFEKPPLWYMATAALITATGQSSFSIRLISSLSGVGIILLSALLAWRWWGIFAGITAWIVLLLSNQLFVTNAGGYFSSHTFRSADLDPLQIFIILIGFSACTHITSNRLMSAIAGITAGLAVLTKGPLGIIPLLVATILFARSGKATKHSFYVAWILFFCTALPWYIFMAIRFGLTFLSAHFTYHIIDRTLLPIEGHGPPLWYYLKLISSHAVFFSWELLTGSVVWIFVRKLYRNPKILYVLVLAILLFIIPTFVRTRLAWYILPFYPFAALVIGVAAADAAKRIRRLPK